MMKELTLKTLIRQRRLDICEPCREWAPHREEN
jgi:hypothetical protein